MTTREDEETLEQFLNRMHCGQVDFDQLAGWYLEEKKENRRLRKIAESADELTVDVGINGKTVAVNREAYETFCQTLIETGWWTQEMIDAEMEDENEKTTR